MKISFELLQAAQQLVTHFNNYEASYKCIKGICTPVEYVIVFSKTSVEVKIEQQSNEIIIQPIITPCFEPLNGGFTEEYIYFQDFANRIFNEIEFINFNKAFWIKKGYIKQDLLSE